MLNAFFECNFDVGGPNHLTAQGPLVLPAHPGRYPHRRWAPRAPAPHPQTADRPWPRPTRARVRCRRLRASCRAKPRRERERERDEGVVERESAPPEGSGGRRGEEQRASRAAGWGAAVLAPTARSAPRRRPTEGPGTPVRLQGGAGICPASRPTTCNGSASCF
jgi:hypothetical protein